MRDAFESAAVLPEVARGPLQVRFTNDKADMRAQAVSLHQSRRLLQLIRNLRRRKLRRGIKGP